MKKVLSLLLSIMIVIGTVASCLSVVSSAADEWVYVSGESYEPVTVYVKVSEMESGKTYLIGLQSASKVLRSSSSSSTVTRTDVSVNNAGETAYYTKNDGSDTAFTADGKYVVDEANSTYAKNEFLYNNARLYNSTTGKYIVSSGTSSVVLSTSNKNGTWSYNNVYLYRTVDYKTRYIRVNNDSVVLGTSYSNATTYPYEKTTVYKKVVDAANGYYKYDGQSTFNFYEGEFDVSAITDSISVAYKADANSEQQTLDLSNNYISLVWDNEVNPDAAGTYTATVYAGNTAVKTITVKVSDDKLPIVSTAADPSTSAIEDKFELVHEQDGMVLTDKTVCYKSDEFGAFDKYDADEFSVALSALGQSYELVETEEIVIEEKTHPDVIFVIDASGSMRQFCVSGSTTVTRAEATAIGLNAAIKELYAADPETRIGIVTFGFGTEGGVYLPLDKYTLPEGQTEYVTWGGRMVAKEGTSNTNTDLAFDVKTVSGSKNVTIDKKLSKYPGVSYSTDRYGNITSTSFYVPTISECKTIATVNGITYYAAYRDSILYLFNTTSELPIAYLASNATESGSTTKTYVDDYIKITCNSTTSITYTVNTYTQKTGNINLKFENDDYLMATNFLINSNGEVVMPSSHHFVAGVGTYTQSGLQAAENMFAAADGKENRAPAIVLLSDGMPTVGSEDADNPPLKHQDGVTLGHGLSNAPATSQELADYGLYTIETAMKVKNNVNEMYSEAENRDALFYTIGPGVDYIFGQTILNPTNENVALAAAKKTNDGENSESGVGVPSDLARTISSKYSDLDYVDYADWSYSGDMSSGELTEAFKKVVTSIIDIDRPLKKSSSEVVTETSVTEAVGDMIFNDVIGDGMSIDSEIVVRYDGKNYAPTSSITETHDDGTVVTRYHYDYSVTESSTGRAYSLSGLDVKVITDADGKQTVKWGIPSELVPIIKYDINTEEYKAIEPIRLVYKVALENDAEGGTYYTNSTEEPAYAEFTPAVGNPYYYDNDEGEDGKVHSVRDYDGSSTDKTENVTDTSETSETSAIDENGKVTTELGNNGKIVIEKRDLTITKVWEDKNIGVRPDFITLSIYKNDVLFMDDVIVNAEDCEVVDLYDGAIWEYTIKDIAAKESDELVVREKNISEFYTAEYNDEDYTIINNCEIKILPDVVVVDYGKPITISPLDNDDGALELLGVGALDGSTYSASETTQNGVFSVEGGNVVFAPFSYMSSINRVRYYAAIENSAGDVFVLSSEISVIPATTVYYEDDFGGSEENGGRYINYVGNWSNCGEGAAEELVANTDINDRQDRGEIGQGHVPYGYDSSYENCTKFSNNTASKTHGTVSRVDGKPQYDSYAEFTFTGTGFDIISRTDLNCGMIAVLITDSNGEFLSNVPVINKGVDELYQIPVISYTGIPYGTYNVKINVTGASSLLRIDGSDFYLDAIRIYDPMGTKSADNPEFDEAFDAYYTDKEALAYIASVRDILLSANSLGADAVEGAVYVDTIDNSYTDGGILDQATIKDIEQIGPNEEMYLTPGRAIGFIVECNTLPETVQLGIKVPSVLGGSAPIRIQTYGSDAYKEIPITNAAEMFYDITEAVDFEPATVDGKRCYKALVILSNGLVGADDNDIISVTNFKMTFADKARQVITPVYEEPDTLYTASVGSSIEINEDGEIVTFVPEVVLKANWNTYCAVFNTVYVQKEAIKPDYDVALAEDFGAQAKGCDASAVFTSSRFVESIAVVDENGNSVEAEITCETDETKFFTEEANTAKTWTVTVKAEEEGAHTYTVYAENAEGAAAEATLNVTPAKVVALKVVTPPVKTEYYRGETIENAGLVLEATYSDGTVKTVKSGYRTDISTVSKIGQTTVHVTYGGQTASYKITASFSLKVMLKNSVK